MESFYDTGHKKAPNFPGAFLFLIKSLLLPAGLTAFGGIHCDAVIGS